MLEFARQLVTPTICTHSADTIVNTGLREVLAMNTLNRCDSQTSNVTASRLRKLCMESCPRRNRVLAVYLRRISQ